MSRAQLTSTVEQSSGGAVSPFLAGKNKVINGDFGLAQRGGTINPSGTGLNYTLDRWRVYNYGSASTTVTQTAFDYSSSPAAAQAPIAGYSAPYFARVNATTSATYFEQPVEDVHTFSGQTITYSFWAKAASAVSGAQAQIYQYFGTGGSANVLAANINYNLTTSWQRITYTTTLPSVVGKTIGAGSSIGLLLYTPTTGVNIDFWGVQVEAGSVATPFTTASNTLQGELALCQRYLPAVYGAIGVGYNTLPGMAYGTNTSVWSFSFPVTPRVPPTGITVNSTGGTINAMALNTPTAITPSFDQAGLYSADIVGSHTITAGQGSRLYLTAGASILFTGCEL